ncbi:FAD/NAD(P)-binding domain-containing protein [Terfezia boudieri ATCC MYA-4762]|uniref:FAD/NAD(P)-binding domain-containing protein n=1 Tax=Terfezia boudieri ATCC MYA-4762 TaxID=1051890 RepID=A0A3N4M2S3_9PEZI|nr:FAD/NAD(P)-binding domain-containing protein [Terfezia boudieri ATCC MYA-4762]
MPTAQPPTTTFPHRSIPKITRIAILGGGPSGIAALARLLKFRPTHFPTIDLFEQRNDVGGIWNYTDETSPLVQYHGEDAEPRLLLPLDDSRGRLAREEGDIPVLVRGQGKHGEKERQEWEEEEWVFPSPIYPSLTANLPKQLMEWGDWPFGREVDMFPGHREILQYVKGYFRRLGVREVRRGGRGTGMPAYRDGDDGTGDKREEREEAEHKHDGVTAWFGKVVREVEKVPVEGREGGEWRVVVGNVDVNVGGDKSDDSNKGEGEERYYDAIVIASGRYTVPYIPDLPGLKEWVLAGKGKRSVEHSREFREVEEKYKGKRILLVGSSISANDILRLLLPLAPSLPIYQSMRSPTLPKSNEILPVPTISHLDPITGDIHLHAATSTRYCTIDPLTSEILPPAPAPASTAITTLSSIDLILFCTGYLLTAPFLPTTHYSAPSPRGTHIPHLLLHCLSSADPTLARLGLPYRVSPWSIAAGQAGVLGRLWSRNLALEEIEAVDQEMGREMGREMEVDVKWEGREWGRKVEGPGRERGAWTHLLTPPRDFLFLERLAGLSKLADGRDEGRDGAEVRRWVGDYDDWSMYLRRVRMLLGEVSERYNKAVAEGRTIRELEEIGLGWEEVMRESKSGGGGGEEAEVEVQVEVKGDGAVI